MFYLIFDKDSGLFIKIHPHICISSETFLQTFYVFIHQYFLFNNKNMKNTMSSSDSNLLCPPNGNRRLGDLKKKLSVHIKKILDDNKAENQEQESPNASKKFTNLQQVQCMKDLKSQIGFFHEYTLGKKLGEGCHSSVYKCISKKQNKAYAVKVTKQKDLQIFSNIRQSYRILKKLQHENIIQAKNLFINQKHMTCHLVLQYCEWQDLNIEIRARKVKFPKQQVCNILTQLLKTVAYMHSNGVCHRDIKPDNILYNQKKGKIKVIDFQIARMKKYVNSKLEMMTKTSYLSYRAPQIFNSIYDERVDIWSVGVIAYQLLTARLPFQAQYQRDEINKIVNEQPSYDGLSVWEQDLLQKLLCKDPNKRATVSQALSSAFFLVNSKVSDQPHPKSPSMMKSPSLGREQFEQSFKQCSGNWNKFYDDDTTNQFLGNNDGDIGVIRYSSSEQSDEC